MQVTIHNHRLPPLRPSVLIFLHMAVLVASVVMICWITKDTINNISFLSSPSYLRFQFWTCLLFLTDIFVEWLFSPHKWKYVAANIFFLLISIPWLNIIARFDIEMSPRVAYLMRFVPMIRAGYVLALISGTLSANRALSMMTVYIIWAMASVYFAALVFFVEEHYVNTLVDSYWSALWWACLSITTVGCEIEPVTATGRVLAVILSSEGLILFPVFTVYVTQAVLGVQKAPDDTQAADSDTSDTTASETPGAPTDNQSGQTLNSR